MGLNVNGSYVLVRKEYSGGAVTAVYISTLSGVSMRVEIDKFVGMVERRSVINVGINNGELVGFVVPLNCIGGSDVKTGKVYKGYPKDKILFMVQMELSKDTYRLEKRLARNNKLVGYRFVKFDGTYTNMGIKDTVEFVNNNSVSNVRIIETKDGISLRGVGNSSLSDIPICEV